MVIPRVVIKYLLEEGIFLKQANRFISDEIINSRLNTITFATKRFKVFKGTFYITESPHIFKFKGIDLKGKSYNNTLFKSDNINNPLDGVVYEILVDTKEEKLLAYVRI